MKISVPVTLTVEVEFDLDQDGNGDTVLESHEVEELMLRTREAIQDTLHAEPSLADDMVERITDNTGWCLRSLSMVAR